MFTSVWIVCVQVLQCGKCVSRIYTELVDCCASQSAYLDQLTRENPLPEKFAVQVEYIGDMGEQQPEDD